MNASSAAAGSALNSGSRSLVGMQAYIVSPLSVGNAAAQWGSRSQIVPSGAPSGGGPS
jgi:hypothetical protein